MQKKLASCIFLAALVLPFLNCGGEHQADEAYYLVTTNTKLPYWQMAAGGLLKAAAQLHVKSEMVGPDTYDPQGERAAFEQVLAKKPTGILVSAADASVMTSASTTYYYFVVQTVNSHGTNANLAQASATTGSSSSIRFFQINTDCNNGLPPSSASSVAVAYTSAQTAGDMNIVVVTTTTPISSVTDSMGNAYRLAITTAYSGATQAIYYAANIAAAAAGANTVTVTFSSASSYPDVRVVEYSGVNTLDETVAGTGTATTNNSGSITTTVANELLFGAESTASDATVAGPGYTLRESDGDGNLIEDAVVSAAGRYSATCKQLSTGAWIMQLATFFSLTSTSAPPAPRNLTAAAVSSSEINLIWTAPAGTVNSYNVLRSTTSGSGYTTIATGVTATSYSDTGLSASTTYYYVVQAVNSYGTSINSAQSSTTTAPPPCAAVPGEPTGLAESGTTSSSTSLSWSAVTPPANCTITRYTVLQNGTAIGTSTDTADSVAGLSPSTTYTFTVEATDSYGTSSASVGLNVTTLSSRGVYYVSPSGSDSNPGTLVRPFLTIQKCATTATSGETCEILAGTYHETVTPNSGITIEPYNGESVTVTGADPVTGWSRHSRSIYKASVTMASGSNQNQTFANQVFVGNQMMTEAQWPAPGLNNDLFHVNWATMQTGTNTSYDPSTSQPTGPTTLVDSNLPSGDWTGAHVHFFSGIDPWYNMSGAVIASSTGQLTVSIDDTGGGPVYCPYVCPVAEGYYYLFGALGLLTEANEWYYNSSTGVLYFWAPGGVNPSTLSVSAKQRLYCFDFSNSTNVTVENINLFACAVNSGVNSSNIILNGINAQYVSHFTYLEGDAGTSESGLILQGSGDELINSTIAYSAGNGVVVLNNGNNVTIKNNLIHHVNYMGCEDAGVFFEATSTNYSEGNITIENNTIHEVGRSGIDGCSGISGLGAQIGLVGPVEIDYNNLFDAMMSSNEGGEIYFTNGDYSGANSIDHNWFHDTQFIVPQQPMELVRNMSGVYLDGAINWTVSQNVLWNNELVSILAGTWASSTIPDNYPVNNNTVPDINPNSYIWLGDPVNCGTEEAENNRVLVPLVSNTCPASHNGATARGANQMTSSVHVGCNFTGCSSPSGQTPPAISGSSVAASIAIQPRNVTVNAGQTATFTVTAAGSPTLIYQWQMNGTNISGATAASYTTPATTTSNNGDVFTVQVSNSIGSVTSAPATLTVQCEGCGAGL